MKTPLIISSEYLQKYGEKIEIKSQKYLQQKNL